MYDDYDDDAEADELRAQCRLERQMFRAWLRHPDPRDPDYPYEDYCEDEEE
jgi:hypothetical protein